MTRRTVHRQGRDGAATRERILRVAMRLVVRHGHEKLSLRDVARRARLSAPSLYEHFDGRAGLLRELSMATRAELRKRVADVFAADAPIAQRLLDACLAYLRFAEERPREFELCFMRHAASPVEGVPLDSPLVPAVAAVHGALGSGDLRAPTGLGGLEMMLALWAQAHGLAVLRLSYLSEVSDFAERASATLNAVIRAWTPAA